MALLNDNLKQFGGIWCLIHILLKTFNHRFYRILIDNQISIQIENQI